MGHSGAHPQTPSAVEVALPGRDVESLVTNGTPPLSDDWPRAQSAYTRQLRILSVYAIVFGLASLVFLTWMIEHFGGPVIAGRVDEIGEGVAAVIGGAICLVVARQSEGRLRIAWAFIGAGALAWAAGEAVWCWYDIAKGVAVPFPSLADVGFLTEVPLLIVGVLVFPASSGNVLSRVRVTLDGLIIGGSLLAVSWGTVLGAAYHAGGQGRFAEIVGLSYPLADVAVATIAFSTLARTGRHYRVPLCLVITGLVALSVSDSAFVYLTQTTTYASGVAVDTGWVVGFFLLGLAALWPIARLAPSPAERRWLSTWQVVLPYAFLGIAGAFIVAKYFLSRHLDAFLVTDAIVLVCIVLARQVLTLLEDSRITRSLAQQAKIDPLTGVGNRLLFAERVSSLLDRPGAFRPRVAVLLCDLDHFKDVNDTLGHSVGDALLVAVAQRLSHSVLSGGLVTRLGGDEFALAVELSSGPEQAVAVAIRVIDAMQVPVAIGSKRCIPRMSIGIAIQSSEHTRSEDLLRDSDVALYATKAAGGDSYRVFVPQMGVAHFAKLQFQSEHAAALEKGQFFLEYEPITDITTNKPVGVEALLRWEHPTRGVLAPEAFLSLAESSGAIVSIGQWVLEEALMQLRAWRIQIPQASDLWMAVNFSSLQLKSDTIVTAVSDALSAAKLDAGDLRVELTETALIDQDDMSVELLQSLKLMGVHLTIDDFGTGYSSISYLKQLPVDSVKIDRTFVGDLEPGSFDALIVESIVTLAHARHLEVVAEGIETEEQLRHMRRLHCDLGQGFLWTRSRSGDELGHWLDEHYASNHAADTVLHDQPPTSSRMTR